LADLEAYLTAIEAALMDADANLSTDLGGQRTHTTARLWRGQVLVDWEPDAKAGDCLLRPALLRRLIDLHAKIELSHDSLVVEAPGRVVAGLSPEHAALVRQLGGARRVAMLVRLLFAADEYRGGTETFHVVERGQRTQLLRIQAEVRVRPAREASRHTSRVPT
jgi:hypothetical protein